MREEQLVRRRELDTILTHVLEEFPRLSDLNFTVGKPMQAEVDGVLKVVGKSLDIPQLTPYHTEMIAMNLAGSDRRCVQHLLYRGSCDLSYHLPGRARFRVNIFSQRGTYSVVMRQLPTKVPSIDDIRLPQVLKKVVEEKNGIVLVTGATGSGKTTTLAAMLNEINQREAVHVVTLEDPVEYVHPQLRSTFNQRELGLDFDSYANGLRAALRQAPKVILVGEMRDRETVEIGMTAAETGHLVLTTLHTVDAGQTINRIIGMFDLDEERLVRIRLADSLRWVISQRLLPRRAGGRLPAFEIMGNSLRVQDAIYNGESDGKTFYEMMQQAKPFGWTTFDDYIISLYEDGSISDEVALAYASRKAVVKRGIDQVMAARGQKTTDIEGLQLDKEYSRRIE
jgi:twitching motility protein PilT